MRARSTTIEADSVEEYIQKSKDVASQPSVHSKSQRNWRRQKNFQNHSTVSLKTTLSSIQEAGEIEEEEYIILPEHHLGTSDLSPCDFNFEPIENEEPDQTISERSWPSGRDSLRAFQRKPLTCPEFLAEIRSFMANYEEFCPQPRSDPIIVTSPLSAITRQRSA